ncbi:UDP-N-acetylmuramoyl-L-alanine--D-glutamate ligase [Jatrophihabitans sp.]|uniref:UDP-N-acetylmuramoyl-L-alanine--D-glutamate ligase n=1 Tax=Jatrophihabitans sp. TaxID=1932789 RepID=UPI0030C732A6|nr:murD [Jatrophihabitans sp.]
MAEPLDGRSTLVCGVGVAGVSAARALLAAGASVSLCATTEGPAVAALVAAGARWLGALSTVPDGVELVIASPGLRPTDPLLVDAAGRGLPVWGEVELAWRLRGPGAAPWLALTGTNGKTTTVHMLEAILLAAGRRAVAVGNVGVSLIDAVLAEPPYDVLAVELSSQQLHFAPSLRPRAGALLNLADDHLDWHGSFAAYAEAKAAIWNADVAVGNRDDERVAALLDTVTAPAVVGFTLDEPAAGDVGVRDGVLVFGGDGPAIIAADEIRPAGVHNVANALAAAALARAYGIDAAGIAAGLRAFVPDPHRNQLVGEFGGVTYVDDSKATNGHAARASLLAYPRIVWIAGGQLKGATVDDLVLELRDRLVGVVLLGVDRAVIAEALRRHAPEIPVIDVSSNDDGAMLSVVRAAAGLARPGDTVLLAPAAASYDMFANYSARGDAFAAAARLIAEEPA